MKSQHLPSLFIFSIAISCFVVLVAVLTLAL